MSNNEHIHTQSKNSNICIECGELIHHVEEPTKKLSSNSLNKTANGLNKLANKIGIALMLVVVGILLFPLGIILWIIAAGVVLSAFNSTDKQ